MQAWLFIMAEAARVTRTMVHHTTLNVTHHHTQVTTENAELPRFNEYMHREMAKFLNVLLAELGYEQPGTIFEDRQTHQMRLLDAEACIATTIYERVNPVAAGLVRRAADMPDCVFEWPHWKDDQMIVVERPPLYFNPRTIVRQRELPVYVQPSTYLDFEGDIDRIVHHMGKLERDANKALARARTFPVLGAKKLRRIHPYNEPRTNRESGGKVIPTFKLGARGITGRVVRIRGCLETTKFREDHAEANATRRAGLHAVYPAGTYKMRIEHDVDVAKAKEDALITGPGMTLDEAKAELDANPSWRAKAKERSKQAIEATRAAVVDEAEEIVNEDRMTFVTSAMAFRTKRPASDRPSKSKSERRVDVSHPPRRSSCCAIIVAADRDAKTHLASDIALANARDDGPQRDTCASSAKVGRNP